MDDLEAEDVAQAGPNENAGLKIHRQEDAEVLRRKSPFPFRNSSGSLAPPLPIPPRPGILKVREISMQQTQTMTLHEQLAIGVKAIELKKKGKIEEALKLEKTIPLAPHLAKWAKKRFGAEALIKTGWNLSEAEAEFGSDWLTQ
jgi:hypothetical protein